jgi:hypothetical protein
LTTSIIKSWCIIKFAWSEFFVGKLGCFWVVAHDKVVMPAQSEMIIRGAVDDSANKLTYETDMLVEANKTFF